MPPLTGNKHNAFDNYDVIVLMAAVCGGVLRAYDASQYLTSPNYFRGYYDDHVECTWLLQVGTEAIKHSLLNQLIKSSCSIGMRMVSIFSTDRTGSQAKLLVFIIGCIGKSKHVFLSHAFKHGL